MPSTRLSLRSSSFGLGFVPSLLVLLTLSFGTTGANDNNRVRVVLHDARLLPSTQTFELERGTQIYLEKMVTVSYKRTDGGDSSEGIAVFQAPIAVSRHSGQLVILGPRGGPIMTVPASARIVPYRYDGLAFVYRDQTVPQNLRSERPYYVVK